MSDALARLQAALAGRYAVERELGQGGMATVYLAEDLKHRRPVAIKVLRPELSATLLRAGRYDEAAQEAGRALEFEREYDRALDLLDQAFAERGGSIYGIMGSFLLAPLRAHPRFGALLEKMNLARQP